MTNEIKAQQCVVVLPARANTLTGNELDTQLAEAYNDALDEVTRLNQPASGGDDAERAAFEAFVQREWPGTSIRRRDALPADHERYGEYVNAFVAHAWDSWQARSALSAPSHGEQVRKGWKLVPVEPTPEMISAAEEAHMPFGDMDIALRCALFAAPSPASQKEKGE